MNISLFLLLSVAGYLAGSIPFGKLQARRFGVDIERIGSGNIGFRNAVRAIGLRRALPVLAGDILKGFIPVIIAIHLLSGTEAQVVAGLCVLGHIFSAWLRFRGGKGIATGLGVTLALCPLLVLVSLATYTISYLIAGESAPSSLAATWLTPVAALWIFPGHEVFFIGLAVLVAWTHRVNIMRMMKGGIHAA